MAKRKPAPRSNPPSSGPSTTTVMVVGAIIVIALLTFSLSRVFNREQTLSTAGADTAAAPLAPSSSAAPLEAPASSSSLPPLVSPRGTAIPPVTAPSLTEPEPSGAVLASIARTEPEQILEKVAARQVTMIDVRDADAYLAHHIPGALHIPLTHIDGEVPYLPRDKPIVTYCT